MPFEVNHPQVPRLGAALARAGFTALMHWSPAMRDLRFDPRDVENFAVAYRWLIERPDVDPARSGFLGTCVGGAFSLMAAADARIRDRVAFVAAYAPFASMWTLARDIASATRLNNAWREGWAVDQLTRKVYVRSMRTFWNRPKRSYCATPALTASVMSNRARYRRMAGRCTGCWALLTWTRRSPVCGVCPRRCRTA